MDTNGAEEAKDGVDGKSKDGAEDKSKAEKASSKKYSQEEVNKLLKDKENSLKGQDGWDRKKLTDELKELKAKNEVNEKAAREARFSAVVEKYGIDPEKAKEISDDPELLEKAFNLVGREPAKISSKPDSGKGGGGSGTLTVEIIRRMTPKERIERRSEIAKMPLTLGSKR